MKKRSLFLLLCMLVGFTAFAQKKVTGIVYDTQNAPIPGVTIMEKGTTSGSISDMDGKFSLNVSGDNAVLVFSFIGMKSKDVQVGTQSTIQVTMEADVSDLDEVVVVGYGVQKKKLVTGATVQVGGENLQKLSTTTALGALQSQAAGVQITQSSGQPGEAFKVTIRGLGTVGTSAPLYVIDGVAGGDINLLNPSDIESIDVLKDAASAAIYGARAANGVILVTTKQGKSGKMQVSYDGFYGVQNVYKMPNLLNASEYIAIQNEMRYNNGEAAYDWATKIPDLYKKIQSGEWNGTNWLDEIRVKDAVTQNHAVNITGGNDMSKFSFGFSYSSQEGILGKPSQSNYDRYTTRINSEHVIYRSKKNVDIITMGENLTYSYNKHNGIQVGNIYGNDIHAMLVANPLMPVYNTEGDYYDAADKNASGLTDFDSQLTNPIGLMNGRSGHNLTKDHNLQGNAYLIIQPIENLKYKSTFGYKLNANSYRRYQPTYEYSSSGDGYNVAYDRTQQSMSLGYNWQMENTLSYAFNIGEHAIDALVGQSVEKYNLGERSDVTYTNSIFSDFDHAYLSNSQGNAANNGRIIIGEPLKNGALASFFGRINYNFRETYMASVVMRADASSNFARGNRWGYFPSVSAGWVITNENFMGNTKSFLDFLKLRGSWGQNGNCNIDNFQYIATVGFPTSCKYSFDNDKKNQATGGYQDILANPDIKWETSEQLDFGFDARFLKSRMGLTFDWYKKTTKDWLVLAPAPATYGTGAPYINGGDVENKGFEVVLNWNDKIGDLTYGVTLNMAMNKNEVTRIANTEGIIHGRQNVLSQGTTEMYRAEVGKPIGYFWGYKTEGIFQNQKQISDRKASGKGMLSGAQPGDVIFADTNNDGTIDEKDKTEIGNPHPDVTSGLNINLGYKGFDLSLTATGAFGQQIAKSYRSFAGGDKENFTTEIFGRWHGEGTSNKLPRLTTGANKNWQNISDIYIEDGDYVKVSNITIGYDFKKLLPKMIFQQARLYFTAQNLYTFTGYSGMDPEVGYGYSGGTTTNDSNWSSGIDLGFYPSPRTYLVGVNLKF